MEIWIKYNGEHENYTRFGKKIPKNETKIDMAKFFGISEEKCNTRIKDLCSDKNIKIIKHKGG